jgi:hypothetical protein
MKRIIFVLSFALATALTAGAQGKGQATPPAATHSNAPAASQDRDKGTDRAQDVGKGKKKGLDKSKTSKKSSAAPKNAKKNDKK